MNWSNNRNSIVGFMVGGFLVLTGTYNAVVINSQSHMSGDDVKFVKRLDEMYGVTVQGREVAASISWQKLKSKKSSVKKPSEVIQTVAKVQAAPAPSAPEAPVEKTPEAAVQEDLTLSLVEVINQKKWKNGIPNTQFQGALTANNGIIEDLSVALPNGEGLSVSFTEMTGNVFEYDFNGELYSGMMYQVDQNSYMVTLTNGPLEGTRLRFSNTQPADDQNALAENNIEPGNFGNNADQYGNNADTYAMNTAPQEAAPAQAQDVQAQEVNPDALNQQDQLMQQQAMQDQGFNLEQQTM